MALNDNNNKYGFPLHFKCKSLFVGFVICMLFDTHTVPIPSNTIEVHLLFDSIKSVCATILFVIQ